MPSASFRLLAASLGAPGSMARRRRSSFVATCAIALAIASAGGVASAQGAPREPTTAERSTARSLMLDGYKKLGANDIKGALTSFRAAHAMMNLPRTGLEVAKTLVLLGQLIEARDMALSVGRIPENKNEPRLSREARAHATALANELAPRIGALVVKIDPKPAGEVRVEVDGVVVSAAVGVPYEQNPGTQKIVVIAAGTSGASATVEIAEGETKEVPLHSIAAGTVLAPPPAAPAPRKSSTPGLLGFGFGAAVTATPEAAPTTVGLVVGPNSANIAGEL